MIEINQQTIDSLETLYKEHLEAEIVRRIAKQFDISADQSLRLYYQSRLANEIESGEFNMQYLDAAYLVDDLIKYEHELFEDFS